MTVAGYLSEIRVRDGMAYMGGAGAGGWLRILDVTRPETPRDVGALGLRYGVELMHLTGITCCCRSPKLWWP